MTTLRDEVVAMCHAIGLEVHGDQVYGPLDSIAILLDLLLYEDQQECSVSTRLYPMARAIAESPTCEISQVSRNHLT